jgi:hypothetical protein
MGVISNVMPSWNRGDVEILFLEFTHIYYRKALTGEHIPQHTQFKVIVQEGMMADMVWNMLNSRSWSTCLKG